MKETSGISIVTACMNREAFLAKALPSWLALQGINEIIIVDWASSTPIFDYLSPLPSEKIKILRIENQDEWVLSEALNIGIQFAKNEYILKLDSDIIVSEEFFDINKIPQNNSFLCGNWENAIDPNQKHLNGTFLMSKDLFLSVNGYNEYIKHYGNDDTDLYNRLQEEGAIRKDLVISTLNHIPHENRNSNQKNSLFPNVSDTDLARLKISYNKTILDYFPKWSLETSEIIKFQKKRVSQSEFEINITNRNQARISKHQHKEALHFAMRQIVDSHLPYVEKDFLHKLSNEEIVEIYDFFFLTEKPPLYSKIITIIDAYKNKAIRRIKWLNEFKQDLKVKDENIERCLITINNAKNEVIELKKQVVSIKSNDEGLLKRLKVIENNLSKENIKVAELKTTNDQLKAQIISFEKTIKNQNTIIKNLENEIIGFKDSILLKDAVIEDLIIKNKQSETLRSIALKEIDIKESRIITLNEKIIQNNTKINNLNNDLQYKNTHLSNIRKTFLYKILIKFVSKKKRNQY